MLTPRSVVSVASRVLCFLAVSLSIVLVCFVVMGAAVGLGFYISRSVVPLP
jgi:hypothetical protein